MSRRRRVRVDDPAWVACCCGGLPLIGLAKGALTCLPLSLYCTVSVAAITAVCLPQSVWHTYKTLWLVRRLGPNLRCLCLLLLPLPLLCWVPLVSLCAALFSLLFGLLFPVICTFSDDEDDMGGGRGNSNPLLTGGVAECFEVATEKLRELWRMNRYHYFLFLDQMKQEHGTLKSGERPFDISVPRMIATILAASMGVALVFPLCALLIAFYAGPVLLRSYDHLWAGGRELLREKPVWAAMLFPVWLLANVLLLPLFAIMLALAGVAALAAGVGAAPVYFQRGWRAALRWSLALPCEAERILMAYVDFSLFNRGSPLPRPFPGARGRGSAGEPVGGPRLFLLRALDDPRSADGARHLDVFPSGFEMRVREERASAAVGVAADGGAAGAGGAALGELPVHRIDEEPPVQATAAAAESKEGLPTPQVAIQQYRSRKGRQGR